jgi:DNA-nicking Smr family endonuclease
MKRPPTILGHFPSSRPNRSLSEEERALWESVAKQVKPLRQKPRAKAKAKASTATAETSGAVRPTIAAKPQSLPKAPPASKQPPPLAPIGRRDRAKLSRGRMEIEARLDLHGMTQVRAHHVLLTFLQRAHHEGLTFVLVITGKGKAGSAEAERGVLRRQVPQWLSLPEFRALVVGYEEAHVGHGGGGALYVRVRRARL